MLHLHNTYDPTQNDAMQSTQVECCVIIYTTMKRTGTNR